MNEMIQKSVFVVYFVHLHLEMQIIRGKRALFRTAPTPLSIYVWICPQSKNPCESSRECDVF
jgi:hypothetical protein